MPSLAKSLAGLDLNAAGVQIAANTAAIAALSAQLDARDQKASVRAASLTNLTLSGAQTIDGVVCIAGDRVAAIGQTLSQNSGIYVCAAGAWSRATDADTSAEVTSGMFFWVAEGTANGDKAFELTTDDPIVLGTTPLTFQQFAGGLKASQIVNDSAVTGATSKLALETLNTAIGTNTTNIATLTTAQALDSLFSPAANQIIYATPIPSTATTFGPVVGAGIVGTATSRAPDNTGYGARKLRVAYVTTAGASSSGMVLFSTPYAGTTGFLSREAGVAIRMGAVIAAVSVNYSWLLGLATGLDLGAATPSTRLNSLFVGADAGDTNAQIMYNDGAGTCTKVDLGANFPARTVGDFYDLYMWCTPGSATINYTVNRHNSAGTLFTSTGTITGANVPVAGSQWYPIAGCCNGGAGGAVAIDATGFYAAVPY